MNNDISKLFQGPGKVILKLKNFSNNYGNLEDDADGEVTHY